jgi:hypothetical protein
MDRNNDGRLSGDEYRDAAALILATRRAFERLDANRDDVLSASELDLGRLPKSAAAALQAGKLALGTEPVELPTDANKDGVLDVAERKALTMNYVEIARLAGEDAAFYADLAARLSALREAAEARFADIEVTP